MNDQPHLFSRTQDFAVDFAEALDGFDEIILLDIYPARERPIEGVSSSWLLSLMRNSNKMLCDKSNLIKELLTRNTKILVTMGAGDIGNEVKKIKQTLLNEV